MDVIEAINTTRAMRRLDPTRDVSDEDLRAILEAAGRAANGGNRQPLRWIVVRDAGLRRALGQLYREASAEIAGPGAAPPPVDDRSPQARMVRSMEHLVEHLGDAPVIILACARGDPGRIEASVYPAIQNLMLAARARGLGTTLTIRLRQREAPVRALLGIPSDVRLFAAIPVGYPLGKWGTAPRRPVEEVTFGDRWGEPFVP
ncbi:MAG: nitroreductase family protein [Chloroflexota bacterium]|nr:nitroreductase family protein [Chloroflexota bacterium]